MRTYMKPADSTYIRTPKNYLRKIKIRRILGLPPKNEPIFISPGVYTKEHD